MGCFNRLCIGIVGCRIGSLAANGGLIRMRSGFHLLAVEFIPQRGRDRQSLLKHIRHPAQTACFPNHLWKTWLFFRNAIPTFREV